MLCSRSKSALTVCPVSGSRISGAISASGASTNRRSRNLGCGTSMPDVCRTRSPYRIKSRSSVRGARSDGRSRPRSRSIERSRSSNAAGSRSVRPIATALRYGGCGPGTSTGSVSMIDDARKPERCGRRRSSAHSRCARRSPRFEPRAIATSVAAVTRATGPAGRRRPCRSAPGRWRGGRADRRGRRASARRTASAPASRR